MKFEESLNELEAIVKKLESNVTLDEAIVMFQRGIELSKSCITNLREQKGKIELLCDEINNLTEELKAE